MKTITSSFFGDIPVIDREITLEEAQNLAGKRLKVWRYAVAKGKVLRALHLRELCGDCRGRGCLECRGVGAFDIEFWVPIDSQSDN